MNNQLTILIVIIGLCSCQQPSVNLTNDQRDKITSEINELVDATFEAGNQKDLETVYTYFDDNTTGVLTGTIIDSWPKHREEGIAFYKSLKDVKYSIIDSKIDVLSNDAVIVYGQYKFQATDTTGNQMTNSNGWTWVWNRKADKWKIVHVHVSSLAQPQM